MYSINQPEAVSCRGTIVGQIFNYLAPCEDMNITGSFYALCSTATVALKSSRWSHDAESLKERRNHDADEGTMGALYGPGRIRGPGENGLPDRYRAPPGLLFRTAKPRQRAMAYVRGLLSPAERKNSWQSEEGRPLMLAQLAEGYLDMDGLNKA